MDSGKTVRMNRILAPDGRTVIVALDHAIAGISPLGALERPGDLIAQVIAGGADAILVTPGMARRYADLFGDTGLIVRADAGPTALTGQWQKTQVALEVEDALRLGADGVIAMGIVGAEGESASLLGLERLASYCDRWGLVMVAEMLPRGLTASEVALDDIVIAARLGAELGADLVKIRFAGGAGEDFRAVTSACYQSIVILGGSKQTADQLVAQVRLALAAGAVGAAVGRNIWQHPEPQSVTRALVEAVHG